MSIPPSIKYTARTAAKRRTDHLMESAEDYVELIEEMQAKMGAAHVTDLARRLGVSHVTVHKTIKRLKAQGLVNAQPYRAITLTDTGKHLAKESRQRHEITLRFLHTLGMSETEALNDAEGMEHHVGPELMARMSRFCNIMDQHEQVTKKDLKFPLEEKTPPTDD
jgi:DtxR family transcriptional regulator, manganese transport regulator